MVRYNYLLSTMHYVYILKSRIDGGFYTGFTDNIDQRVLKHNDGSVVSTRQRKPFDLVYFEGCLSKKDALHREIYLKTAWGKRYIKNRLKNFLVATVRLYRELETPVPVR